MTVTTLADRCKYPPYGLFGGRPGGGGRWTRITKDGEEVPLSPFGGKVSKAILHPGESVRIETPSGGGYGDPLKREPRLVLNDVIDGYITFRQAERDYGVIIDKHKMKLDLKKTRQRRSARAHEKRAKR
jgi:N-methylhydantoinase B/oxoprolinase/acetone carboxylase alpha subunit